MMYSWTALGASSYKTKQHHTINYVELLTPEFETLFETFGRSARTYFLQIDYNHFLAFRMNKKDEAIANLKTLSRNYRLFKKMA